MACQNVHFKVEYFEKNEFDYFHDEKCPFDISDIDGNFLSPGSVHFLLLGNYFKNKINLKLIYICNSEFELTENLNKMKIEIENLILECWRNRNGLMIDYFIFMNFSKEKMKCYELHIN